MGRYKLEAVDNNSDVLHRKWRFALKRSSNAVWADKLKNFLAQFVVTDHDALEILNEFVSKTHDQYKELNYSDVKCKQGCNLLYHLVKHGNLNWRYSNVAIRLIDLGFDVNNKGLNKNGDRCSTLYWAVTNCNSDLTKVLISSGAEVSEDVVLQMCKIFKKEQWEGLGQVKCSKGLNLLCHVVRYSSLEANEISIVAKKLIELGFSVDGGTNDQKNNPVYWAAYNGNESVLQALIKSGAQASDEAIDAAFEGFVKKDLRHIAAHKDLVGYTDTLVTLAKNGADINGYDESGRIYVRGVFLKSLNSLNLAKLLKVDLKNGCVFVPDARYQRRFVEVASTIYESFNSPNGCAYKRGYGSVVWKQAEEICNGIFQNETNATERVQRLFVEAQSASGITR